MARSMVKIEDSLVGGAALEEQAPMFIDAPAGPIAAAWLAEYSERFTSDDLIRWLKACPRHERS
jgi:hypothetical protein